VHDNNNNKKWQGLPLKWKLQLGAFFVGTLLALYGFQHDMPILACISVCAVVLALVTSTSKRRCAVCEHPMIFFGPAETSFCPKCGKKDETNPLERITTEERPGPPMTYMLTLKQPIIYFFRTVRKPVSAKTDSDFPIEWSVTESAAYTPSRSLKS
jgi:hypothetical protein